MDNSPKFQWGRYLIADEMGLGKSYESLLWVCKHEEFPCVIVCPATLKYNWQDEIRTHFGVRALVLEGRDTSKQEQFLASHRFIILNFQILEAWLKPLRRLRPATLILDECQQICNRSTQSYANFMKLSRRCKNFIALSGTPLLNAPAELWPVLNILRPDKWPGFWTFAIKHCDPRRNRATGRMEFKGARKLDVLFKKMRKYVMIRRRKTDVLDLPPKIRHVIPLPLEANSEYKKAELNFAGWLKQNKGIWAVVQGKQAMNNRKLMVWRQLVIKAKMKSVIKWVENWLAENDEKLVIMFCHTEPIEIMMRKFKDIAVRVDGNTPTGRVRQDLVKKFQRDEKCRLFVGNMAAAGVGLTLTAAANLAFAEFPWTPAVIKQVEDRCHRISQERQVNIYYLVAHKTVEQKVAKKIASKDSVLNEVLDGGENEQWNVDEMM